MPKDDDWFTCPVCGQVVPAKALACPECGADDETGWSETAEYDDIDLPGEAFGEPPRPTRQSGRLFTVVAVVLVLLILYFSMSGLW